MPRRAVLPCDARSREALEQLLSLEELEGIRQFCEAVPIPFVRWPASPTLARYWGVVLVERAAQKFMKRGCCPTLARERAAHELGLSHATLKTWRRRERAQTYQTLRTKVSN